jgi:hypothetical protein
VRPRSETIFDLYGPAERERANIAEKNLVQVLYDSPTNAILHQLLLDIYYDRAAAEAILAGDFLARAERIRFGGAMSSFPPVGRFVIDTEIAAYRQLLATNRRHPISDY